MSNKFNGKQPVRVTNDHLTKSELKSALEVSSSRGDRVAIWITDILGSLTFLAVSLVVFLLYFLWNLNFITGLHAFDPYPFSILCIALSMFAVILSISVLISQNRQRRIEKIREKVEFEINVRAEDEITKILGMLHEIQRKLGIDKPDPELEQMKQAIDLDQLHKDVGENEKQRNGKTI